MPRSPPGFMRGSSITFAMPSSLTAREDQTIHEKQTVSSGSRFTVMGKEVTTPSGTSSPQHSTNLSAPALVPLDGGHKVLMLLH